MISNWQVIKQSSLNDVSELTKYFMKAYLCNIKFKWKKSAEIGGHKRYER